MIFVILAIWIAIGVGCCEYHRRTDPHNVANLADAVLFGIIMGPVAITLLTEKR